ncbi:MAG TPA: phage terminase large subunit [Candidatus Bathyarchaeia archaeon]|nr:phage terminase large subunit [Candidatus Bathyarchaeia archaeon]
MEGFDSLRVKLREDPVVFAEAVLGFHAFPYQSKLLLSKSKRIVACWARQTGKTTAIAVKVIHFAFTNSKTTLIVSRGLRQSMIMFGVIEGLVAAHPMLRKSVVKSTRTLIHFRNGSQIIALPCGPDGASLRGYTADLVVMDEAAFMPEDVIASVIFPMLATTDGAAIMLSTPWGRDHIFYRSFKNPDYWSQHVKAEECPRISKEFLEEQRRDMGELRYKMEYEAEFIEDENSFFSQDLIRECVDDYDLVDADQLKTEGKIRGTYFLGADFGKRVDYSVVVLMREEEEQRIRLVFLKQFPLGTTYTEVVGFIRRLNQKFDIAKGFVDQSAVGESLVEEIKEFASQIDGLTFTVKIKQDMMILLQTRMEQKKLTLPMDRALLSQINEQQYRFGKAKPSESPEEKGVMTFYHPSGTHDDQLWALALAVYAAREKEPEPHLYVARG